MPDRLITHLRHVDIAAPDFGRQLEFYTKVWGLTQVGGDTGVAFLAAEGSPEQYVVRLRKGGKRLDLLAFGAENPAHVDELSREAGHGRGTDRQRARAARHARRRLRLPVLRRRRAHDRGLQ